MGCGVDFFVVFLGFFWGEELFCQIPGAIKTSSAASLTQA